MRLTGLTYLLDDLVDENFEIRASGCAVVADVKLETRRRASRGDVLQSSAVEFFNRGDDSSSRPDEATEILAGDGCR